MLGWVAVVVLGLLFYGFLGWLLGLMNIMIMRRLGRHGDVLAAVATGQADALEHVHSDSDRQFPDVWKQSLRTFNVFITVDAAIVMLITLALAVLLPTYQWVFLVMGSVVVIGRDKWIGVGVVCGALLVKFMVLT